MIDVYENSELHIGYFLLPRGTLEALCQVRPTVFTFIASRRY